MNSKGECIYCHQQNKENKLCGRCKLVWYCSSEHQKKHWKKHRPDCHFNDTENSEVISATHKKSKNLSSNTIVNLDTVDTQLKYGVKGSSPYLSSGSPENLPYDDLDVQAVRTEDATESSEPLNCGRKVSTGTMPDCVSDTSEIQFENRNSCKVPFAPDDASNLQPPLDKIELPEESETVVPVSTQKSAAFHVDVCPEESQLADGGFDTQWFTEMSGVVVEHLNKYGLCVLDNFLGNERAHKVFDDVKHLHENDLFRDGQVVSPHVSDPIRGRIRGDKITWVTGNEPSCTGVGLLMSVIDSVISRSNKHPEAGKLSEYNVKWRSRAMVACYPGEGAQYMKHVDNPNCDGRCITAIYYINLDWKMQDGGILRIYPEGYADQVVNIEPLFDRMLFFWSDRRNPHEVLPTRNTRYAVTVWYLDQKEREEYLVRMAAELKARSTN